LGAELDRLPISLTLLLLPQLLGDFAPTVRATLQRFGGRLFPSQRLADRLLKGSHVLLAAWDWQRRHILLTAQQFLHQLGITPRRILVHRRLGPIAGRLEMAFAEERRGR